MPHPAPRWRRSSPRHARPRRPILARVCSVPGNRPRRDLLDELALPGQDHAAVRATDRCPILVPVPACTAADEADAPRLPSIPASTGDGITGLRSAHAANRPRVRAAGEPGTGCRPRTPTARTTGAPTTARPAAAAVVPHVANARASSRDTISREPAGATAPTT